MPRTTLALTSFVSGEFSAKMDGRSDFEKYTSGVKTMENFLVHPQGSATRRVGTQHIAEVKDSTKKTRLIEKYSEPKSLLHFQWGDDTRVYRYCLVDIIEEKDIDPTTKCKKNEQGLTQQEIFKKICLEQH